MIALNHYYSVGAINCGTTDCTTNCDTTDYNYLNTTSAVEVIQELDGILKTTRLETIRIKKLNKATIKKEGRERSKIGWINFRKNIVKNCCILNKPEWPFRISMGGAND